MDIRASIWPVARKLRQHVQMAQRRVRDGRFAGSPALPGGLEGFVLEGHARDLLSIPRVITLKGAPWSGQVIFLTPREPEMFDMT